MTFEIKTAVVFGGTGFIGQQVVRELANRDIQVKIATRIPEHAYFLRPCGNVGQIVPFACDYSQDSIERAVKNCDYVVNCVGILNERRRGKFKLVHTEIAKMIAAACKKEKVKSFVHISALACERASSKYAQTKHAGEQEVLKNYPKATILRPSVVFGEDDHFFNMFAEMSKFLPFLPLIGGGKTEFQPVYVGDVAEAVIQSLENQGAKGQIFELAGPETVSFKEIYQIMMRETKRQRRLIFVPMFLAKLNAFFLQILPHPPLTPDQVESLKTNNVMNAEALRLEDLGINPTMMEMVLPQYLERYRPGGRFAYMKTA